MTQGAVPMPLYRATSGRRPHDHGDDHEAGDEEPDAGADPVGVQHGQEHTRNSDAPKGP